MRKELRPRPEYRRDGLYCVRRIQDGVEGFLTRDGWRSSCDPEGLFSWESVDLLMMAFNAGADYQRRTVPMRLAAKKRRKQK